MSPDGRGESGPGGDDLQRKAFRKACDFLARRPHSARQLRQKLSRTFEPETVEYVLDRLAALRYLDDSRFALEYAVQRLEHSPRGTAILTAELRSRGVDAETARDAVKQALNDLGEDETSLALRAAGRRTELLSAADEDERRNRLLRFLAGRGFCSEAALGAVEKLLDD